MGVTPRLMRRPRSTALTWNSVVLRMWRPSGLQQEAARPADPSSILQCHSGCSKDHTCVHHRKAGLQAGRHTTLLKAADTDFAESNHRTSQNPPLRRAGAGLHHRSMPHLQATSCRCSFKPSIHSAAPKASFS